MDKNYHSWWWEIWKKKSTSSIRMGGRWDHGLKTHLGVCVTYQFYLFIFLIRCKLPIKKKKKKGKICGNFVGKVKILVKFFNNILEDDILYNQNSVYYHIHAQKKKNSTMCFDVSVS